MPEARRPKRLGVDIKPEQILARKGDAARGRAFFFSEGTQCSRCHRLQDQGREFGPDLSQIGRKYSRDQLLDQVLHPSRLIDPVYRVYQVETRSDELYSGFLLKRTPDFVLLKDPDLREHTVSAADIKSVQPQQLSAMPEGLLQNVTAQAAAVANETPL
jgi:putative heme-binding domain-containing protein